MTDIVDVITDSVPDVEYVYDLAINGIRFNNQTISSWEEYLKFPAIPDNPTPVEILKINKSYIAINETIVSNYAIAKSAYSLASMNYQNALKNSQSLIIDKLQKDNKKIPAMDSVEKMASHSCQKEFYVLKINEIFLDFWKIYYDKIHLLDARLTSISYLMRN